MVYPCILAVGLVYFLQCCSDGCGVGSFLHIAFWLYGCVVRVAAWYHWLRDIVFRGSPFGSLKWHDEILELRL